MTFYIQYNNEPVYILEEMDFQQAKEAITLHAKVCSGIDYILNHTDNENPESCYGHVYFPRQIKPTVNDKYWYSKYSKENGVMKLKDGGG